MKSTVGFFAFLLVFLSLFALNEKAEAWNRGKAAPHIIFPAGKPEAITSDRNGNYWASLYNPDGNGVGRIVAFNETGQYRIVQLVGDISEVLVGIHYRPSQRDILIVDNSQSRIYSINPTTNVVSLFLSVPSTSSNPTFLNDITEDASGNVYITDSFVGAIYRTDANGANFITWVQSPFFRIEGNIGANGLAFTNDFSSMIVASSTNHALYRIPLVNGQPNATGITIFGSIHGPDGVRIDGNNNVWAASNLGSQIVAFDPTGKVIGIKGDFSGLVNGYPLQLFTPSGIELSVDGNFWYVANAAFPIGLAAAYASEVSRHTIAKVSTTLVHSFKICKRYYNPTNVTI